MPSRLFSHAAVVLIVLHATSLVLPRASFVTAPVPTLAANSSLLMDGGSGSSPMTACPSLTASYDSAQSCASPAASAAGKNLLTGLPFST